MTGEEAIREALDRAVVGLGKARDMVYAIEVDSQEDRDDKRLISSILNDTRNQILSVSMMVQRQASERKHS